MSSGPKRIEVENVNVPGRTSRAHAGKCRAMRDALLPVLPQESPGLTQQQMFEAVLAHLPQALFPGGATAQPDLEAKGRVGCEPGPALRWHRSSARARV